RYNLTGGSVVANGGGANSQGLYANQLQVSNDGSLTATGGDGGTGPGQYGYGLDAGSITINAGATGTVRGVGGSGGINSYGISTDRITQNGGNLAGDGGSVRSAYGISASSLEMANDATLTGIGGTGDYSYGVSIRTINHNSAGLVLARGNTGTDSYGIQASAFNQNAGAVQAVGGGGVNAVGMRVNGTITITGGTVDADGGGASGAHGFYANYYAQDGGDVVADGNGADAGGVRVYYSAVISAGTVAATGGGGANSYGFYTGTTFTLESGTVQADGGAGVGADGVRINTAATVNGGGIVAGGGGAANADGVHAGSLALADGTVEAVGGTAADAVGVRVNNALTIAGGTIQATGSASAQADGVAAGSLSLDAGTIQADGGGSADAAGMRISGAATLSGGRLDAVGGGADRAYGLSAGSLSQNAGTATASAGGGQAAHGIAVAGLASIGAGGNLTATGGDSGTYGLSAGSFDLSGLLRMERGSSSGGGGASVYVDSPDGTVLRGGSVLAPVVDIGRGVVNGSGLLQTVPGGTVVIENGARLDFWFIDHRNMSKQVVYDDYVFIDTGELAGGPFGSIVNEFVEQSGGLSLEYIARKNEFGQYVLSVKRVLDIPEIIDMVPCANARRLMGIFDDLYDPGDVLISRVLMAVDHSRDRADLVRISAHIGKTLTPTAYSKLTGTQLRAIELVQDSVQRRLAVLSAASRSEAAAYPGAVVAVPRWTVWADALHQQSSRFKPACVEFDSPKEKLYGVSTGLAGEYQNLAFAAGFGYVAGSYRSGYSDIDTDNYSLTAGLTLRGAEGGGWFVPSATLVAGYAYGDIDQHLLNYPGDGWKRSSPAAHMARASLELAAETRFGPFTVAPFVGLDYAFIRQQGYSENDPAGFGLRVRANNFNSLRPRVGVALEMRPSDRLAIGLRAQYRIEALDRRSSFTYGRISAPEILIPFAGEDRNRHSGDIGATARYRLNDRAHLSGEYRLLIEDKYLANRFGIGLEVAF
ncbi:MAG: autotransporter domain-containing protein, partial [Planctomycetes bacterium]|nr:autotransporter domain-containing protein [Planctomycetota bacterium]